MKKVEARKKVHLYIHANDADRLRIVVFSHLWYIFVYTGGENMDLSYRAQIMSKDVGSSDRRGQCGYTCA